MCVCVCVSGGAEACDEGSSLVLCGVSELSVRASETHQEPGTGLDSGLSVNTDYCALCSRLSLGSERCVCCVRRRLCVCVTCCWSSGSCVKETVLRCRASVLTTLSKQKWLLSSSITSSATLTRIWPVLACVLK